MREKRQLRCRAAPSLIVLTTKLACYQTLREITWAHQRDLITNQTAYIVRFTRTVQTLLMHTAAKCVICSAGIIFHQRCRACTAAGDKNSSYYPLTNAAWFQVSETPTKGKKKGLFVVQFYIRAINIEVGSVLARPLITYHLQHILNDREVLILFDLKSVVRLN